MHQTLIRMIGKLPDQKKVNWPVHLPEVVQAYNGTQSAIMGYSPHYLMFGLRPRFPIDLYFPTLREKQKNSVLIIMLLTSRSACNKHWKYLRNITKMKPCDKSYFDCLTGTVVLRPGDIVLLCTDSFVGKRKIRINGVMQHMK